MIEVLQTFALPLGYGAVYYIIHTYLRNMQVFFNDSYGNRTRVTAVKGRCLNRLTKEPSYALLREALVTITVPSKPHM